MDLLIFALGAMIGVLGWSAGRAALPGGHRR